MKTKKQASNREDEDKKAYKPEIKGEQLCPHCGIVILSLDEYNEGYRSCYICRKSEGRFKGLKLTTMGGEYVSVKD